jgi:hypothetical protein
MFRLCAKLTLLLLLCSSVAHAQSQNLFFVPPTFPGSGTAFTADLNNDGKADLINADGTVLLGNGDGAFKTGTPWFVSGQTPGNLVAVADFNSDGKPDLLLVNQGTAACCTVFVMLGNGDGTFQTPITTANMGTSLGSVMVADFNGDGKLDIVGIGAGGVWVFFGKGDGTFTVPGVQLALARVNQLAIGDFNGDGKTDILVATGASDITAQGSLEVFLSNGNGTFQSVLVTSGAGFGPLTVAVGDVNGDSRLDVVLTTEVVIGPTQTPVNQTFTLLGNGDGTFQAAKASGVTSPNTIYPMLLVDVNKDKKLDLILANPPFTQIWLGNGDGTFSLSKTYFASGPLLTADFNRDGNIDIAAIGVSVNLAAIGVFPTGQLLLGNGDGTFQGIQGYLGSQYIFTQAIADDFNGDGFPDVATIVDGGVSKSVLVLLNDGAGNIALAHSLSLPQAPIALATADLNGDHKADLVALTTDNLTGEASISAMLGNGDGSFGPPSSLATGITPDSGYAGGFVVADFNGDHKPDAAFLDIHNSNILIFPGNGDGTFAPPAVMFAGQNPSSFLVGDFNNDGILDIADGSQAGLGIFLGKGDGTFQAPLFSITGATQVLTAADLNGDGNLDLMMLSASGQQVLLGNGDGTFTAIPEPITLSRALAVADVNGDGKPDLILGPGVTVHLGNGDGTFGAAIPIITSLANKNVPNVIATDFLVPADFHHNGHTDILADIGSTSYSSPGLFILQNIAPAAPADFGLAAKPLLPVLITPGSSATSTVTVTDISGFTGSVALSCSELPSGASCNFSTSSVSGAGTSTLTITTTSSLNGTYPIVVTGTSGSITHTVVLNLTVGASGATTITLTPSVLTFASQATGTSSAAQITQLTNFGGAALSISSVSVTGANAGDFAQTNNCASGLAAGSICRISVTFTPTSGGARSAAITITDNATGSPQMITLNGSAPDFTLAAGSPQSATVTAGQTGTYTLAVTPGAGFTQNITFSYSGNPALTTCSVAPNPLVVTGSGPQNVTVTVTTAAPVAGSLWPVKISSPFRRKYPPNRILLALCLTAMALLSLWWMRYRNERFRWAPLVSLALLICVVATMVSCGGGSSGGSGGGGKAGTQAGTYTISVNAIAGSGAQTHTMTFTLIVQ